MAEYIEREKLLKEFDECFPNLDFFSDSDRGLIAVRTRIEIMPAADVVEVKHGEWLKTEAYPHRVYCSLCYKTYVTNEEVIRGRSDGHFTYCSEAEYCPHCGAKMDLKEGAEE